MTELEKSVRHLRIEDYNYPLPDNRIARHPLADREQCKLLLYHNNTIETRVFAEVPCLLPSDSMLIYNNTRVINARVRFKRATGALIEIFCLEPVTPHDYELVFKQTESCTWLCLVGNGKRWKNDTLSQTLEIDGKTIILSATRGERRGNASEIIFNWTGEVTFASVLDAVGEIPIPPYLNRDTEPSDSNDYQTVYSHIDGSVAAPTAGLHFTDRLLKECDSKGIERRELTLHVGAGTFQPVKSELIGEHPMHHEFIAVKRELLEELCQTEKKVIAVGTTSVRTLESLYYIGLILEDNPEATGDELDVKQWVPYTTKKSIPITKAFGNIIAHLDRTGADTFLGSTQLMIAPGFKYRIVEGMITNFHQPQSTLLLLVAAFVGNDNWRQIYDYALENDFRFLSYGDACLLLK